MRVIAWTLNGLDVVAQNAVVRTNEGQAHNTFWLTNRAGAGGGCFVSRSGSSSSSIGSHPGAASCLAKAAHHPLPDWLADWLAGWTAGEKLGDSAAELLAERVRDFVM